MSFRALLWSLFAVLPGFILGAADSSQLPNRITNAGGIKNPDKDGGEYHSVTFKLDDSQFNKLEGNPAHLYLNSISLGIRKNDTGYADINTNIKATLKDSNNYPLNETAVGPNANADTMYLTFKDNNNSVQWSMVTYRFPSPLYISTSESYTLQLNDGSDKTIQNLAMSNVESWGNVYATGWSTPEKSEKYSPLIVCDVTLPHVVDTTTKWSDLPESVRTSQNPVLNFGSGAEPKNFTFDQALALESLTFTGSTPVNITVPPETASLSVGTFASETDFTAPRRFFEAIKNTDSLIVPVDKTFTIDINGGEFTPGYRIAGSGTLKITGGQLFNVNAARKLDVSNVLVEDGRLRFNDPPENQSHEHLCNLTVGSKGFVQLSNWGQVNVALPKAITLKGGSMLVLYNAAGNQTSTTVLGGSLKIDASATADNPATLHSEARTFDNTKVTGTISGSGTLRITSCADAASRTLPMEGVISGEINLIVDNCGVNLTANNTYTGTTELRGGAIVKTPAIAPNEYDRKETIGTTYNIPLAQTLGTGTVTIGKAAMLVQTTTLHLNKSISNEKIVGDGTIRITHIPNDFYDRTLQFGFTFNGTSELLSGFISLDKNTHLGSVLRLPNGGEIETKATLTLPVSIELGGATVLHCNEGHPLTISGNLTALSPTASLTKRGAAELILKEKTTSIATINIGSNGNFVNNYPVGPIKIAEGACLEIRKIPNFESDYGEPRIYVMEGAKLKVLPGASYQAHKALVLESGAILDVTEDVKLSVNAVTLPNKTDGTLTVMLPEHPRFPMTLIDGYTGTDLPKTCNVQKPDGTTATGYLLRKDGSRLLLDMEPLPRPTDTESPEGTAYSPDANRALLEANGGVRPTAVDTTILKKPLSVDTVNTATRLMKGVAYKSSTETNKVLVDYCFGIAGINIVSLPAAADPKKKQLYVVLKAEVSGSDGNKSAVTYAFDTLVRVFHDAQGDTQGTPVEGVEEVTDIDGVTRGGRAGSVRYVRFPMPEDGLTHTYRLSLKGGTAELVSAEVAVPAHGADTIVTRYQEPLTLMTLTPQADAQILALKLSGAGTYKGQKYRLIDANDKELATATMQDNGLVIFKGISISANTAVKVEVLGCAGDITIVSNTWDASGITEGKTVPIQGMIAVHPKYDFQNETWSKNITGEVNAHAQNTATHSQYRIPGVASNGNGETVAVYDIRWRSQDDLGVSTNTGNGSWSPIDIGESYSQTDGSVWDQPKIGIDVENVFDPKTGKPLSGDISRDIGDPCIVYVPGKGEDPGFYLCMAITGGGLMGYGGVGSPTNGLALYKRAEGENVPWERAPGFNDNATLEDAVYQALFTAKAHTKDNALSDCASWEALKNRTRGVLQGPGHGFVTTIARDGMPAGTIVFPMQWFFDYDGWFWEPTAWTGKSYAFALYSTNGGTSWKATQFAPVLGTQENSICELDDGSWYMIAKHADGRYCFHSKDFITWEKLGDPRPSNAVQGSVLRLGRNAKGIGQYAMAYSTGPNRSQLKIFFGQDGTPHAASLDGSSSPVYGTQPIKWEDDERALMIHAGDTGGKSYNSMCLLDGGRTLGILYEANMHIYFKRIDISDRVQSSEPASAKKN